MKRLNHFKLLFNSNCRVLTSFKNPLTTKQSNALNLFGLFSQSSISRRDAYLTVRKMSQLMTLQYSGKESVLLVPILRAGIAMWPVFNEHFNNAQSAFPICSKVKGTNHVEMHYFPKLANSYHHILILDVVSATGDTVISIADQIKSQFKSNKVKIDAIFCYISPEAIAKLSACINITNIYACIISDTVDPNGRLVPSTEGDVGDKLFGQMTQKR